jgi:hypothetical protein
MHEEIVAKLQAYLDELEAMTPLAHPDAVGATGDHDAWLRKSKFIQDQVLAAEYEALVALPRPVYEMLTKIRKQASLLYPRYRGK